MAKSWEEYLSERKALLQEIDKTLASDKKNPAPAIRITSATGSEKTIKPTQPELKVKTREESDLEYMNLRLEMNQALRFYSVDTWKEALEKEWKARQAAPEKTHEETHIKKRELRDETRTVSIKRIDAYKQYEPLQFEVGALLHQLKHKFRSIADINHAIEIGKTLDKEFAEGQYPIGETLSDQLEEIRRKQDEIDKIHQEFCHESYLPSKERIAKIANEKHYTLKYINALENNDQASLQKLSQAKYKPHLHPDITERRFASLFPMHKQLPEANGKWQRLSQHVSQHTNGKN